MRVIIEKDYEKLSKWAADHVVETINRFQPTDGLLFWVCQPVLHLRACMPIW